MQNFVKDCLEKLEILKSLILKKVDINETDTVINVVEHESSFREFEKGARRVEKIVTHAHRVSGVLWRHQSHAARHPQHMAKQFHSVQDDMRIVTKKREPHCACDRRLECETRILNHVPCLLFSPTLDASARALLERRDLSYWCLRVLHRGTSA